MDDKGIIKIIYTNLDEFKVEDDINKKGEYVVFDKNHSLIEYKSDYNFTVHKVLESLKNQWLRQGRFNGEINLRSKIVKLLNLY